MEDELLSYAGRRGAAASLCSLDGCRGKCGGHRQGSEWLSSLEVCHGDPELLVK